MRVSEHGERKMRVSGGVQRLWRAGSAQLRGQTHGSRPTSGAVAQRIARARSRAARARRGPCARGDLTCAARSIVCSSLCCAARARASAKGQTQLSSVTPLPSSKNCPELTAWEKTRSKITRSNHSQKRRACQCARQLAATSKQDGGAAAWRAHAWRQRAPCAWARAPARPRSTRHQRHLSSLSNWRWRIPGRAAPDPPRSRGRGTRRGAPAAGRPAGRPRRGGGRWLEGAAQAMWDGKDCHSTQVGGRALQDVQRARKNHV